MDLSTCRPAVRGVLFGGTLEAAASKLLEFRKSDGTNELERPNISLSNLCNLNLQIKKSLSFNWRDTKKGN